MNLVDTSGWIEFFFAGPHASFFAPPIEKTEELIVPVICLYEVFKKVNVIADEARALKAVAQMMEGKVVDLTEDVALRASLLSIRHKLPMANSLIYATALAQDAVIWTQDQDFRNLPRVNFLAAPPKAGGRRPGKRG